MERIKVKPKKFTILIEPLPFVTQDQVDKIAAAVKTLQSEGFKVAVTVSIDLEGYPVEEQ